LSLLRRNNKEEDTFGEKDSDWDVYKQISREAEDSDSEEETLKAQVRMFKMFPVPITEQFCDVGSVGSLPCLTR
jgi:hypothetical protein